MFNNRFASSICDSLIPENWNNISEFSKWWCNSGMPLQPPSDAEIFLSDDATAFCIFRKGQFQVELYLIHSDSELEGHYHPGLEIIQMQIKENYGLCTPVLKEGMSHGESLASMGVGTGLPIITFEHWLTDIPSTAAAAWKGPTVGPKQEALIRRFYPNAFVESGYADITKPSNYRQLLLEGKA